MTLVVVIINSVLRSLILHFLHLGLRREKIETAHSVLKVLICLNVLTNRVCHSSVVLNPSLHLLTLQLHICYSRSHSPEKRFIIILNILSLLTLNPNDFFLSSFRYFFISFIFFWVLL